MRWLLLALLTCAACSNGAAGHLTPLGDAGDAGGPVEDGGECGAPYVQVDTTAIDFGNVVGGSSVSRTLVVTNISSCPVLLDPISPQGISETAFTVTVGSADFTASYQYTDPVPPGGVVNLEVSFLPAQPSAVAYTAYLIVAWGLDRYFNVGLRGFGVRNGLCVSTRPFQTNPPSISFPPVPLNVSVSGPSITVGNCANEPIGLYHSYLEGSDGDAFAVGPCPAMANCQQILPDGGPYTLQPGDVLTYPIDFTPSQGQGYAGEFAIVDDHYDNVIIPLSGGGGGPEITCQTVPATPPEIALNLSFGPVVVPDGGSVLSVICTNTGNDITLQGKIDPRAELQVSSGGLTITQPGSSFSAQLFMDGLATTEVSVRAGEQFIVQVAYDPTEVTQSGEEETATLQIQSNAPPSSPVVVLLYGQAVAATQ
jgi:hypothetical protein